MRTWLGAWSNTWNIQFFVSFELQKIDQDQNRRLFLLVWACFLLRFSDDFSAPSYLLVVMFPISSALVDDICSCKSLSLAEGEDGITGDLSLTGPLRRNSWPKIYDSLRAAWSIDNQPFDNYQPRSLPTELSGLSTVIKRRPFGNFPMQAESVHDVVIKIWTEQRDFSSEGISYSFVCKAHLDSKL